MSDTLLCALAGAGVPCETAHCVATGACRIAAERGIRQVCYAAGSGFGTLCVMERHHEGEHLDAKGHRWTSRCYASDELCLCDNPKGHTGPHACACLHEWTKVKRPSHRALCRIYVEGRPERRRMARR